MDGKRLFVLILVISTSLGAVGQLIFKLGLDSSGVPLAELVGLGVVLYALSTMLYFYVLGRSHLSWAYSFVGLSYSIASILAFLVLGEPVTPLRVAGIAVIQLGIIVIGLS